MIVAMFSMAVYFYHNYLSCLAMPYQKTIGFVLIIMQCSNVFFLQNIHKKHLSKVLITQQYFSTRF